jgi:PKD repeat protein
MKISTIYLLTLLACILLLGACDKESGHFANGDQMVSFGVVGKNIDSADSSYIIHLDNGDQLFPVATIPQGIELVSGQRVQVTFSPYDEKISDGNQKTYYGRIDGIRNILLKNIISLTATNNDSIGNDPVAIRESWVSGDSILTVNFSYFTNGSVHAINLVKNAGGNGTDQPFVLEFRHNAVGDQQNYRSPGIISFNLTPFKLIGQHQTDFILRYTDYEGKKTDLPLTISY